MDLPKAIKALPKAAQDRWKRVFESLDSSLDSDIRSRTATALVLALSTRVAEDWSDLPDWPDTPVVEAKAYSGIPAKIAVQLPIEAQKVWMDTFNMCCIIGCSEWQCEDAAWKAVDLAGFAPDNLPKYTKVKEGEEGTASGEVVEQTEADVSILFREATDASNPSAPRGSLWDVTLITAGRSKNRRNYNEAVLRAAAPLFEGVKAYADHDLSGKQAITRSVRDVVGWYSNAKFDEGVKGITAQMHIFESASWLRNMLVDMTSTGAPNLIGLSINASGEQKPLKEGVNLISDVVKITQVYSVDVVTEPAAGGGLVRLVASVDDNLQEVQLVDPKEIRRLLESGVSVADMKVMRPDLSESIDTIAAEVASAATAATAAAAATATAVREAVAAATPAQTVDVSAAITEAVGPLQETIRSLQTAAVQAYAASRLAESKLPKSVKDTLSTNFNALLERRVATNTEFDLMLTEANNLWAAFEQANGSGAVRGMGGAGQIREGEGGRDEFVLALDGMLLNKDLKDSEGRSVRRFRSFKESYFKFTGHDPYSTTPYQIIAESTGNFDSAIHADRIEEAMSTASWPQLFSDRMYRRMLDEYRLLPLDDWRSLVSNIENVPDFRSQRRERLGGYGLLETVGELETYPDLTSPTDEEVTYAVEKHGGLEYISFEMIVNDDLANIRRIPTKLARAAHQTLFRFVLDFLKNGFTSAIYDGDALFHANHANLDTDALSDASLAEQWTRMRSQTAYNNDTEVLGTRPKYLWVPAELEQFAWKIANSAVTILGANYNATEPNFFQNRLEVKVVDYWTDVNNWFLTADPNTIPTIELGFLNGQEEPDLFVQDQPNVGAVMTADKITYKIRHIYSGTVLDYRGMTGNNVA